jgi:nitrogen fixation/metabolism regulation signal transduction histidine kinase
MMNQHSHFEQKSNLSRIKELITLTAFILIAALISIVVMDLLVLPLSLFAINHKSAFNFVIKDISVFVILFIIILTLVFKVIRMRRDGLSASRIVKYMLMRPLRAMLTFMLVLVTGGIVIYILSLLLNFNYYRIYLFTQI